MKKFNLRIQGEPVVVNVVEDHDDVEDFQSWYWNKGAPDLGLDTETTGLDIYSSTFGLRTVQVGDAHTGWVFPYYADPHWSTLFSNICQSRLYIHNASFDIQVLESKVGVTASDLWKRAVDTRILAHLVDPRGVEEGGIGQGLEALTRHYIDREVADNVKTLAGSLARELGTTKSKVWAEVSIDNPDYLLYAGVDPILSHRLGKTLEKKIPKPSQHLVQFEHEVARVCSKMETNGFLLDVPYTENLSGLLLDKEMYFNTVAMERGVEAVNSGDQVADALESMGVKIPERTPTGKRKVDKKLLESLVEKHGDDDIGTLSHAVLRSKKARKWRQTWVDKFLTMRDAENRCHPSINTLRARTARMSITGIPAQTLPSSDSMIRSCFIADPGCLTVSVDYKAQELRVLAALSGDNRMKDAFRHGEDLHQITADTAGVDRKVGKMANFLTVYGGGPKALASQGGVDEQTAMKVLEGFNKAFPQVDKFSKKVASDARKHGCIWTPTGRRLPVDADRSYSALNYIVQSTSRDVTAAALLRLDEAGFGDYMRLPIHDEVLFSLPVECVEESAREAGTVMTRTLNGVTIGTDPDIGGQSWGSLYS